MNQSVILFDGICVLCSVTVRFIIRRDPQKKFKFAQLQSAAGQKLLKQFGVTAGSPPETMILIDKEGGIYKKSSAMLGILKQLSGGWPLLFIFIVVPHWLRDAVYDFVGRKRYQWFGKLDHCWLPNQNDRDRFL